MNIVIPKGSGGGVQTSDKDGNPILDSNGDPALNVIVSASADLSGVEQVRHMIATIDTNTPSGTADIFNDATGVKVFTVTIDPDTTLAAGASIVVGYGTTAGDTGVETNAINCSVEQGGVRTGQAYTNVVILNANNPYGTIVWDSANTIKRIAAVTSDAADCSVTLITVG